MLPVQYLFCLQASSISRWVNGSSVCNSFVFSSDPLTWMRVLFIVAQVNKKYSFYSRTFGVKTHFDCEQSNFLSDLLQFKTLYSVCNFTPVYEGRIVICGGVHIYSAGSFWRAFANGICDFFFCSPSSTGQISPPQRGLRTYCPLDDRRRETLAVYF